MKEQRMTSISVPWVRSENGMIFGVCQGVANRFDADVMLVRLAFVVLTLMGFSGIVLYLAFAIGIPHEAELPGSMDSRLFGVCARFARRFHFDVGLVRSLSLLTLLCTGGTLILVYFALYFILPTMEEMPR
jgi:phage shock protein PspC (stress-responsive transcriptional regulator)